MNKQIFSGFLQLFAEGTETGVMAPDAGVQGVKQGQSEVIAQTSDTGEQTREAEFQRLIQEEYKDLYDARVQDIVRKRLKGQQETLARPGCLHRKSVKRRKVVRSIKTCEVRDSEHARH